MLTAIARLVKFYLSIDFPGQPIARTSEFDILVLWQLLGTI